MPGRFNSGQVFGAGCPAKGLLARGHFVARGGRSGFALGARAIRAAAPPRKSLATTSTLEAGLAGRATVHLRLRAGDEGGQTIDADGVGDDGLGLVQRQRLRLGLILRLRTMVAFAM